MTFPAWLTARVAAGIGIALLVALVIFGGPAACNKIRSMGAQSRVDHAQTGALSNSASDAVNTVGNRAASDQASDDLTASNDKEIRNAQGANAGVDPAVSNAGLNGLCRRAAYAHDPACQLRRAAAH